MIFFRFVFFIGDEGTLFEFAQLDVFQSGEFRDLGGESGFARLVVGVAEAGGDEEVGSVVVPAAFTVEVIVFDHLDEGVEKLLVIGTFQFGEKFKTKFAEFSHAQFLAQTSFHNLQILSYRYVWG